jgi:hypothetical protein
MDLACPFDTAWATSRAWNSAGIRGAPRMAQSQSGLLGRQRRGLRCEEGGHAQVKTYYYSSPRCCSEFRPTSAAFMVQISRWKSPWPTVST